MNKTQLNNQMEKALDRIIGEEFEYFQEILDNVEIEDCIIEISERNYPKILSIYAAHDTLSTESSVFELEFEPILDNLGNIEFIKLMDYAIIS